MVDQEIIQEWVLKADEDFRFALVNLEEGKPFFAQICFHFQQAAEKFLKAYIIAHGLEFRKIHDLSALLKICESNDSSFKDLRLDVEFLNIYYIDTRYPVHWPTRYSQEEAEKARASAQRIRSRVRQKLDFQ